jgi:hypothetical protein
VIMKRLKVERLFPLYFSISHFLSFAYNTVKNKGEVWHKCLGHPNFIVLSCLLNFGFLGNKDQFSSHNVLFDCSTCKLGKNKTLPFTSLGSRAIMSFNIIHSDVWDITVTSLLLSWPNIPLIHHTHHSILPYIAFTHNKHIDFS